ncbi:MAG: GNAT family N-acetyltransferase [Acidobacteria bacterium]|nr:MAG: GNAT family N-acetyltransferase [Acidobacteriota bacterium]
METPQIRPARPDEAPAITELALRSKGHWGYPPEFLEACREELTVTPARCAAGSVVVAVDGDRVLGYHDVEGSPPDGELAALFVAPDVIGTGLGAILLRHALEQSVRRGLRRLVLDADPGAEGFYARFGAVRVGEAPSGSIPGRVLPRMVFDLTGRDAAEQLLQ